MAARLVKYENLGPQKGKRKQTQNYRQNVEKQG